MKKINLEIVIPEDIGELKDLVGKIVGILPLNNSVSMPLVYFGKIDEKHEFLQQEIRYDMNKRKTFFTRLIKANIIPERALEFMENGIYFDRIQYNCYSEIYWPDNDGYKLRLLSLKENKLWVPSRGFVKA